MRTNNQANSLVKLIKKAQRQETDVPAPSTHNAANKWASVVRTWVNEFHGGQRIEQLPAFDSLFKDART